MGSDYGSSGLAILAASNRTHRPLITISHCLIMGIDYGSLGSLNPPYMNSSTPFHTMYSYIAFLGCSLGSIGGGPEKDRDFCCWALSIAPHGYAWPAGDLLVLLSPSLRVSRTSSCPRTVRPNMLLPPLEDIVWPLTESEGPS